MKDSSQRPRAEIICLLGGGELLWRYLIYLRDEKLAKVFVLSSARHLDEVIGEGSTLRALLLQTETPFLELDELQVSALDHLDFSRETSMAVSFGASWIIRQPVIDWFDSRLYNVHGTRLPQDRGGASISWQIMRGNRYGFALIHQIEAGIDTGNIVSYHEFLYEGCQIPLDYQRRYNEEALILLKESTHSLLEGHLPLCMPQTPYLSSYWPRLNTRLQGWIDWSWSGMDILKFICAFDDPYPGAHTMIENKTVYLKSCHFDVSDGMFHPFQSGLIYRATDHYLAVCTTTGTLLVQELFDEQGQQISLSAIRVGTRLFTPIVQLEQAKRIRVQYTPVGLRERTS